MKPDSFLRTGFTYIKRRAPEFLPFLKLATIERRISAVDVQYYKLVKVIRYWGTRYQRKDCKCSRLQRSRSRQPESEPHQGNCKSMSEACACLVSSQIKYVVLERRVEETMKQLAWALH